MEQVPKVAGIRKTKHASMQKFGRESSGKEIALVTYT
jgi:hypothetical protein